MLNAPAASGTAGAVIQGDFLIRARDFNIHRQRLFLIVVGCALGFAVLTARFFYIQVLKYEHYAKAGENQSTRRINLYPVRGDVLEAGGGRLAVNAESDSGTVRAADLPQDRFPSLKRARRLYPMGTLMGQVLGFVGRDGYGLGGVEYEMDEALFGEKGWMLIRQDAKQRRVYSMDLPVKHPINGLPVRLTVRRPVQEIAEECLARGVSSTGAVSGCAIVVDPKTGDVLALANYPGFDPNLTADPFSNNPRNFAISLVHEPGSTFKVVAASAALEEGVFREEDVIRTDGGKLKIYDEYIHDMHNYGALSFTQAVAVSSNVAFAKIGLAVGDKRLYRYMVDFGFGQKTGIMLPGEEAGLLKDLEKWSGRTLATVAMGHEISVTPLQIAMAYAAVANEGVLMTPRIIAEAASREDGAETYPVRPVRRVVSPRTARRITACLTRVVDLEEATGNQARIEGLEIAGKTGTAEKIDPETRTYLRNRVVASFVGFFPAYDPQLLCLVALDEPRTFHTGGATAAPVFKQIVLRLLHSKELPYGDRILNRPLTDSARNSMCRAPALKGLPVDSAMRVCAAMHLVAELSGNGDRVEKQSPAAGKALRTGGVVRLSAGERAPSPSVKVPDVRGLSLRQAVLRLRGLRFQVQVEGNGFVRAQKPAGGQFVKEKSVCRLTAGVTGS